jgi:hypothetical protein
MAGKQKPRKKKASKGGKTTDNPKIGPSVTKALTPTMAQRGRETKAIKTR